MKTLLLAMLLSPQDDGFVTLFNGKDLEGWTAAAGHAWVVEDGVIALKGKTDGAEHNGEYLWTKEQYGDFVLELEFKVPEKANSGIFLRPLRPQGAVEESDQGARRVEQGPDRMPRAEDRGRAQRGVDRRP